MIQVSELSKAFNKNVVFENMSFQFSMGQFVTIIGRNGSGKSTLLKILAKQLNFERGEVFYHEKSIQELNVDIGNDFAYLTIDPFLSQVEENLEALKNLFAQNSDRFELEIFQQLVKAFSLDLTKGLNTFSLGQRIKALFALFAARRPEVYFLDEITAVLDPGSRFSLLLFLKEEVKRGALVLACTNIAPETEEVSDLLMVLGQSGVQFLEKRADLSKRFHKYRVIKPLSASDRELIEKCDGRVIDFNTDQSVSVLFPETAKKPDSIDWVLDNRTVTISDISKYFSVG